MNKQEIEKAIEVIKKFKHFADLVESPDEYFQHMQGHTKELSLVLNVFDVADLCDDIVKLLNHQLTNRWIPVSERLPEDEKYYNVTILQRKNPVEYCFYNKSKRKFYIVADGDEELDQVWEEEAKNVIAWQPLPEPYKEESND